MNGSENNFETLKQLLSLKRHEVPPPGYFHHFSGQVVARIRAGETGRTQGFAEQLQIRAPWLANFLQIFETKPGLIVAFATSLCLLLVAGLFIAEQSDSTPKNIPALAENAQPSLTPSASASSPILLAAADQPTGIAISTNPVLSLQPAATLFGQQNPIFQSASFAPVNH